MYVFPSLGDLNAVFPSVCESVKNELGWEAWSVPLARSNYRHSDFQLFKLVGKEFLQSQVFFLAFTFLVLLCLRFQGECLGTTHLFWCLVGINVTGTLAIYSCIFLGCQLASKGIHL